MSGVAGELAPRCHPMAAVRLQAGPIEDFAQAAQEGLRIVCAECGTHVGGLIGIREFQVTGPGLTLNGVALHAGRKMA